MFDEVGLTGEQRWFYHWIQEREKARNGRENNLPKPWTDDKIIQNYRFCNVRREDDKITKWIKENWRDPYPHHENLVFAMCIARLFNRIETLELIGFPDFHHGVEDMYEWSAVTIKKLKDHRDKGAKIWTGAYLVSTNGHSMDKIDYIMTKVLQPIWRNFKWKTGHKLVHSSLQSFHEHLCEFDGMGSFMAGQVVADLKYTPVLLDADDWAEWAPIGPGSKRGLNRYFGRELTASIKPHQVLIELDILRTEVWRRLQLNLPAHDIQNCACETDKFIRTKNGEGKPRSSYNGTR